MHCGYWYIYFLSAAQLQLLQPKIKQDFRKAENFLQERGGRKTDDQKTDNLSRQKQQKQWKKDRRVRLTDVTRGGVYNEILSRFEAPPQMKTDTQSQIQCKCKYKYENRIFPEIRTDFTPGGNRVVTNRSPSISKNMVFNS